MRDKKVDVHQIFTETESRKKTPVPTDFSVTYIKKDGTVVESDDHNVAAKISSNEKMQEKKYFIKSCHGEFYNPEDFEMVRRSQVTELEHLWRWVEVPPAAFDNYLHFLKTRNAAYFAMAVRACD